MKKIISLLLSSFIMAAMAYSQQSETIISHYIFPEFTAGKVLMKNGKAQNLKLNYNSITEEMVFENSGKNLAIANVADIDTVYIQNRKFIPAGKAFYEVAVSMKTPLLIQYTCSVIPPGKPAGYGTTTETSSVDVINSMFESGKVYELKMPGDYRIIPSYVFFLKSNDKFVRIANAKQVINVFPEKETAIKDFIKKNKTDFKDKRELSDLIIFCNK